MPHDRRVAETSRTTSLRRGMRRLLRTFCSRLSSRIKSLLCVASCSGTSQRSAYHGFRMMLWYSSMDSSASSLIYGYPTSANQSFELRFGCCMCRYHHTSSTPYQTLVFRDCYVRFNTRQHLLSHLPYTSHTMRSLDQWTGLPHA